MAILIKNGTVYSPQKEGTKDVLVINGKVFSIQETIQNQIAGEQVEVLDAAGSLVIPGLIDQHVHFNGAGGEGGPAYRTPPLQLSDFIRAGITSAIGLLGTDGITRSLRGLLQKARGLENEGISTWMYTGSYQVPPPTLTGEIKSDIVIVGKVRGVKTAVADHRSSHPSLKELKHITSEARVGGMLTGKLGVVHIHMGEEEEGFSSIWEVVETTDIPVTQFAPTHVTRSEELFEEALEFGRQGGYVDVTAGGTSTSKQIQKSLDQQVPVERITLSSDGGGSMPKFNDAGELKSIKVAPVVSLYEAFVGMLRETIPIPDAIKMCSTNIAQHLDLDQKGELAPGKDADILIVDKETFQLEEVIAHGKILMKGGKIEKFGTYEGGTY